MDFGRSKTEPNGGWQLPPDDVSNPSFGGAEWSFHVGCPLWGNPAWVGRLYPPGTKSKDFLRIYSHSFDCIEYNGSFYHLPSRDQVEKWLATVPSGFLFCPKMPQVISHAKNFDKEVLQQSAKTFLGLKQAMGLAFLQMPPSFRIQDGQRLKDIVELLDGQIPLAIELRHPSWLKHQQLHPRVREYFTQKKLFTVILDTPGRRDLLHSSYIGDQVVIRFLATGEDSHDSQRLKLWCQRIKLWRENGLKRVFFFCHQPEDRRSPELACQLIEMYNHFMGENHFLPQLESQRQGMLF